MFTNDLCHALAAVLEKAAFVTPTEEPHTDLSAPAILQEQEIAAFVDSGEFRVCVWAPDSLCGIMANNMAGFDPSRHVSPKVASDVLAEICNMTAGLLAPVIGARKMTVPHLLSAGDSTAQFRGFKLLSYAIFPVDDDKISATLLQNTRMYK